MENEIGNIANGMIILSGQVLEYYLKQYVRESSTRQ